MSKLLRFIIFSGIVFFLGSCSVPKTMFEGMHKKHWLVGAWKELKGHTTEEWTFVNKNLITGRMYSAVSRDTITVQTYKLERKNKEVLYSAAMHETSNTFIHFKLKSETPNSLIFENTKDAFPKNISYILNSPTSLTEIIEGTESNGEFKKREFNFTKVTPSVNKK